MRRTRHYLIIISIAVLLIISLLPGLGSSWNALLPKSFSLEPESIPEDTLVEYLGLDSTFLAQFTVLEGGGAVSIKDTVLFAPKSKPITKSKPTTTSNTSKPTPSKTLPKTSTTIPLKGSSTSLSQAERIRFRQQLFDTYIVDLRKEQLQIFWKNDQGNTLGSIGNVQYSLEQQNRALRFATNAGIFAPGNRPEGLFVENGKEKVPINLQNGQGNFYMKPNGVFLIGANGAEVMQSEAYLSYQPIVHLATQSGPMLLTQGRLHPKFRKNSPNKYIRSGVGIISQYEIVFIISRQPVNFYDFASVFKYGFGCENALYLDGAISQMYLPELGRTDLGGNFAGILVVSRENGVLP